MTKRMLIDASHAEETRVVVLDGNRLEDFDVETATKRQLKGNIYLAKVVRVEPSLQAAFVEYGGNRHGFLAFDEIHPDYYQIPVADRQRLLDLQAEQAREEAEAADRDAERHSSPATIPHVSDDADGNEAATQANPENGSAPPEDDPAAQPLAIKPEQLAGAAEPDSPPNASELAEEAGIPADLPVPVVAESVDESGGTAELLTGAVPDAEFVQHEPIAEPEDAAAEPHDQLERQLDGERTEAGYADPDGDDPDDHLAESLPPETIGGENDTGEDAGERRIPFRFLRNYKIQEVIRRRQILLVQVVKEERGTKGAALTTYISLAGRYGVLMPNSPRGGGISRKITSPADRRRLKEVMAELDLPDGMGLIVRTAGANRPKPEIKRDCEYLLRLWDDIREHTMRSVAPALIYEEANLIKRAVRDVYSRDVDEVVVDGEDGWRAARDFMRMLMPSHVKKVQLWRDSSAGSGGGGQPLFTRYQVDAQLDAILSPTVQLRSGGYLVINQTEALVAIDVNSGRSTRERGIEETALRTNTEAAEEVARQLRLRDLAGLIVIDFIDMESKKHNGMVERRLKEALKADRARIQVGYISHFGLLEMSRQRLRPSLAETSFITCPHCGGTGHVRSTESAAIHVLRGIEEEGAKRRAAEIVVHTAATIAMYIFNHKRDHLAEIETRSGMRVSFAADEAMVSPQFRIERVRAQTAPERPMAVTAGPGHVVAPAPDEEEPAPFLETDEADKAVAIAEPETAPDSNRMQAAVPVEPAPIGTETGSDTATAEENDRFRRKRRRRRRGGRRDEAAAEGPDAAEPAVEQEAAALHVEGVPETAESGVAEDEAQHRRGRRGRRRRRGPEMPEVAEPGAEQPDMPPVYVGPTPADPYGGHAFDIFDVLEEADLPFIEPAPQVPTVTGPPAGEPVPDIEPESPFAPESAPSEPAPEPKAEPAAEPVEVAQKVPANDAEPTPAIAPIVIGADEPPAAEKKRGWWRR